MSPSTEHLTVQSMTPIIPHLLYGHSDVYSCYGVKIKALMDAKGRGSIQQGAAFNQGSLCVKSIIHLVTVSATPGCCLYSIHTLLLQGRLWYEIHSFYTNLKYISFSCTLNQLYFIYQHLGPKIFLM